MAPPAPLVPTPSQVRRAFNEALSPGRQSATLSWLSFTVTFIVVRFITHRIRDKKTHPDGAAGKKGGIHDLSFRGIHLHHYLWGICTVSLVAGLSLRVDERIRRHPLMAIAYGIGMGLIVDEFALLLDLKDVYWAKEGRTSVDLAIALSASAGTAIAGGPLWRRLRHERLEALAGRI